MQDRPRSTRIDHSIAKEVARDVGKNSNGQAEIRGRKFVAHTMTAQLRTNEARRVAISPFQTLCSLQRGNQSRSRVIRSKLFRLFLWICSQPGQKHEMERDIGAGFRDIHRVCTAMRCERLEWRSKGNTKIIVSEDKRRWDDRDFRKRHMCEEAHCLQWVTRFFKRQRIRQNENYRH